MYHEKKCSSSKTDILTHIFRNPTQAYVEVGENILPRNVSRKNTSHEYLMQTTKAAKLKFIRGLCNAKHQSRLNEIRAWGVNKNSNRTACRYQALICIHCLVGDTQLRRRRRQLRLIENATRSNNPSFQLPLSEGIDVTGISKSLLAEMQQTASRNGAGNLD